MPKDKSLENKAIDIKGKKYVLVSDRIIYFNETYPTGCIQTELVSDPESDSVIIKATIVPEVENKRAFTGYSQAIKGDGFINKTAALENAETSAVGRALAMMGIGVIDSVASVDEINKAEGSTGKKPFRGLTAKQKEWLFSEARQVSDYEENEDVKNWIEGVLDYEIDKIPSWKCKDAVDKIKLAGKVETDDSEDNLKDVPY